MRLIIVFRLMIILMLIDILSSLLFNCMVTPLEEPGKDIISLNCGFETGDLIGWGKQFTEEGYSIVITPNSPRKGNYCVQFNLRENDFAGTSGVRSELEVYGIASYKKEVYYGWSIKLDSSYAESSDWQVIGQFHDQPDFINGETWDYFPAHSPPISYTLVGGEINLAMSTPGNKVVKVATKPITKGVWHDIVTHIFWSDSSDGYVEAWIDNVPFTPNNGNDWKYYRPNMFNRTPNFLKLGLYRSKAITTTNTIYYDEIKVGKTYAEVLP